MADSFKKRIERIGFGLIVLMLSTVFVLEFGSPRAGGCGAELESARYAAKVYDRTLTEGELRAMYTLGGFNRYPAEMAKRNKIKETLLDGLVERTLLARAAKEVGFHVSEDEVMRSLVEEGKMRVSAASHASPMFPDGLIPLPVKNDQGVFDKESARRFIQFHLRRSVQEFAESQVEEALAQKMRDLVTANVQVTSSEVWNEYRSQNEKVRVQYIRFSPSYYADVLTPTPEQVQAWAKDHSKEVDEQYTLRKQEFTNLQKQVRARHLLFKIEDDSSEEQQKAALAKAQAALARIKKGESFSRLAWELSEDSASARKGGDLGFNPKGRMVDEFDKVQFALPAGQVSEPVKTQYGYHIIEVLATREGTVAENDAKREIAEQLYRQHAAEARAKQVAQQIAGELKGGASIEQVDARLKQDAPPQDTFAPHAQKTELFSRQESPVYGGFDAQQFTFAAFALTQKARLSGPIQLGEEWFVLQLDERVEPEKKDMAPVEARLRQTLVAQRRKETLDAYVRRLRDEAKRKDALSINAKALQYTEPEGSES